MKVLDEGHSSNQAAYFVREAKPQPAPLGTVLSTVTRLRAFAQLLCLDATRGDELLALTLLRASPAIRPSHIGPELSAWLLSRLCSYYHSEFVERSKSEVQLSALNLSGHGDALLALARLSSREREVLLLVEAARFSVEEASRVSHCKVAQVKLLLAGARARFANVVIALDGRSID
jgi:DNA-directed RNA polymerase specialized sigma24 family protein